MDCFRGNGNNLHRAVEEIRENMLSEANEENKEMLEKVQQKEE